HQPRHPAVVPHRLPRRQPGLDPPHRALEPVALNQLHRIEQMPLMLPLGINGHDIRMVQLRRRVRLGDESLDQPRRLRHRRRQHLKRHHPVQRNLPRPIDRPHAPPPHLGHAPQLPHPPPCPPPPASHTPRPPPPPRAVAPPTDASPAPARSPTNPRLSFSRRRQTAHRSTCASTSRRSAASSPSSTYSSSTSSTRPQFISRCRRVI